MITDDIDVPDRPTRTPTESLIRLHYKRQGCYSWDRPKFLRLARALNETIYELGARVGLNHWAVDAALRAGRFPAASGILLSFHWRFAEFITTGEEPKDDLFPKWQSTIKS